MKEEKKRKFCSGYFLKLLFHIGEEAKKEYLVILRRRPAEFFLITPRIEELDTFTFSSLNQRTWTAGKFYMSQEDSQILNTFSMTPTYLRQTDDGTVSFIKTKNSSEWLKASRILLAEEIYQKVDVVTRQYYHSIGEKQIPCDIDNLFELEPSSSGKIPGNDAKTQKPVLAEIVNENSSNQSIISKQQQNLQYQKQRTVPKTDSTSEHSRAADITSKPMVAYASSSVQRIIGTGSLFSSTDEGCSLKHPRLRLMNSKQIIHKQMIDETEVRKNNNIENVQLQKERRDGEREGKEGEEGEGEGEGGEGEEGEGKGEGHHQMIDDENQDKILQGNDEERREEMEKMKVPRHPRFNLQKIPFSYNNNNNNINSYNKNSKAITNNDNNNNNPKKYDNNNNKPKKYVNKNNNTNNSKTNNNNKIPGEVSSLDSTTTTSKHQCMSKKIDGVPKSQCYQKACRVLITKINSTFEGINNEQYSLEEESIGQLPFHHDKDYDEGKIIIFEQF